MPHLTTLTERHPRLRLALSFSDQHVRLFDDDVDIAVRIGAAEDSSLRTRVLRASRLCCVAAPTYLGRAPPLQRPDDLDQHRCLAFVGPGGVPVPWQLRVRPGGEALCSREVTPVLALDSGPLVVLAAVHGAGVCQALDFMVAEELRTGLLVEVLPRYAAPGPVIRALYRPASRDNPALGACLDMLSGALAAGPGAVG